MLKSHNKNFKIIHKSFQTTIKKPVVVFGLSAYKNKKVKVEFLPSKKDTGIVFEYNGTRISASIKNIVKSRYHTTEIKKGQTNILTIEHVMAVMVGFKIDNLIVKLQGDNQLPMFDGSAKILSEKFMEAGIKKLSATKKIYKIEKEIIFTDKDSGSIILVRPAQIFSVQVIIDFSNFLGLQKASYTANNKFIFAREIAPARTFFIKNYCQKEYNKIRKNIVSLPEKMKKSTIISYNHKKYYTKLRFTNEPARHKLLDFMGDLALAGVNFEGDFFVYKPGHSFTQQFLKEYLI